MKRICSATPIASLTIALMVVLPAITLFAQAPRTMSHQGLLTDLGGTPVANASRSMTFKIYDDAVAGTALWKDAFADQNRVVPETEKNAEDRGRYLHPEALGKSSSFRIGADMTIPAGQAFRLE